MKNDLSLKWLISPLLLLNCNSLFYYPDRKIYDNPTAHGINYEMFSFPSADGTLLCAWWFFAQGEVRGTIVQLHGNAENMTSHYRSLHWLTREGYALLAFDYRGYGCSAGVPERSGILDDAVAAYRYVAQLPIEKTGGRIIIYGQSLGGKIAQDMLLRLQEDEIKNISGMVLESTFESYQQMAADAMKAQFLTWPFSWLAWILVTEEYSLAGQKHLHPPTLVIHGTKDKVVPYRYAAVLAEKFQAPLLTIEGGGHIDSAFVDAFRWRVQILAYLDKFPHRQMK